MDVYQNMLYRSYIRKHDMEEPSLADYQLDEQDNWYKRIERMSAYSKD